MEHLHFTTDHSHDHQQQHTDNTHHTTHSQDHHVSHHDPNCKSIDGHVEKHNHYNIMGLEIETDTSLGLGGSVCWEWGK